MATLLLLTNDMRSSAEILPALELLPPRQSRPSRSHRAAGCTGRGCDLARCPTGPGRRPVPVPAHRDHRQRGAAARHRSRRRAGRTVGRLGLRRPAARDRRAGRGGRTAPAGHDAVGRNQCRPGNPVRQHHDRRGRLQRQAQWCPARSHLHRVRAVEVPRTAPGTCSAASSC